MGLKLLEQLYDVRSSEVYSYGLQNNSQFMISILLQTNFLRYSRFTVKRNWCTPNEHEMVRLGFTNRAETWVVTLGGGAIGF